VVRAGGLILSLLLSGCLLAPQTLDSPCVGKRADTDGGACPACMTDADCSIASNRCYASASCVPTAGNWGVPDLGCSVEHPPTTLRCGCINNVCTAR
jgi:hypothetical protein